ncbi:MAG: hypothetical protein IKL92_05420 [Oscillospiraceae bacterium]|nr:hypothetical protein [Oscillospiraceae bacterium]
MRDNHFVSSLTALLSATILSTFVVNLLGSSQDTSWHMSELSTLGFALVCFVLNFEILKKECRNWHIALMDVLLAAAGFVFLYLANGIPLSTAGFLLCYTVFIIVLLSWQLSLNHLTLFASSVFFQSAVVFIVLYIWVGSLTTIIASDLLWLVFMCGLCLLGMLSFRITGAVHSRKTVTLPRTVLLAISCGLLLIVVLLLTVAAKPLGNFVLAAFSFFGRILSFIMKLIMLFFEWLDKLFAHPTGYEEQAWTPPSYVIAPEELNEGNPLAVLIFIAVLFAIAALMCLVVIVQLLKQKHTPEKTVLKNQKHTRVSPVDVIKRILSSMLEKIWLWWMLTVHRDTPVGVYVRLTRACRLSRYSRRKGETPRTFITRLASVCREMNDFDAANALIELADEVDRLSYSQKTGFGRKFPGAGKLYSNTVSLIRRSQLTIRKSAAGPQ